MSFRHVVLACALFAAQQVFAQDLPMTEPETVGMSRERLERITTVMKRFVGDGMLPGISLLIARKGRVAYFEQVGFADVEKKTPMRADTIVRLYSQTKPITGVAAMVLFEEGKFLLTDPVSKYLPEYKNMKVLLDPTTGETEPARQMTIKHLLTHTAGLTYWTEPGWERRHEEVGELYREAGLVFEETKLESLAVWSEKLAELPLVAQPGEDWHYGVHMEVLGRLIEVWSGRPLEIFLAERIFQPLGMRDTAFYVSDDKLDRFAANYEVANGGGLKLVDSPETSVYRVPPKVAYGGDGLVSTAPDYFRFVQMLLNGGHYDGARILGRKTVELMLSDHIPLSMSPNPVADVFGENPRHGQRGMGFGFTGYVIVNAAQANSPASVGSFGWGGAASTVFWLDPKEELLAVMLTQQMGDNNASEYMTAMTYQALVDSADNSHPRPERAISPP